MLYKLVIANRLKPLMVKLISPVQTSFVPGRKINENILIAQGQRRKERGILAVKIDLHKAYDHLHWDFVKDTFEDKVS